MRNKLSGFGLADTIRRIQRKRAQRRVARSLRYANDLWLSAFHVVDGEWTPKD